jgi:putative ABC transport system permease protein
VGFGFFETYDIGLVTGRTFNEAFSTDVFNPPANVPEGVQPTGSYILNEAAVRQLGLSPEEVLGRTFEMDVSNNFSLTVAGPVIGVVADVHLQPLRQAIEPLAYFVPTPLWGGLPSFNRASVRLTGNDVAATIAYIEQQWRRFVPEVPLIHHFLDTDYAALYQDEIRQGQLFSLFAALTILIACLGLFGLASYTVERRRREIGVRKVLGGSVWNIVLLLTNEFSRLVLLANVLAWPVLALRYE